MENLTIYGTPDKKTEQQMYEAMRLPVAVAGALMPDAHLGYGLPIGGVLATEGCVIPYAVGVDIACRVKLSRLDMPVSALEDIENIRGVIEAETRFGPGAAFEGRAVRSHAVMEDPRWELIPHDKSVSHAQLGTSGGGNHFIDIGILDADFLGPPSVAIMTHSGSRGAGFHTCKKFSAIAAEQHPSAGQLGWLDFETPAGDDYWNAMELMGEYAHANHECIHAHVSASLGARVTDSIENHHNFAWREGGRIVHRKGATPAGAGVLGVVPGTMLHKAHIIRGLGMPESLNSSAHGAGRLMSRTQAKKTLDREAALASLADAGVTVLGAGADELPGAYKDIEMVMREQAGLAETIGTFTPKIVKMAGKF